MLYNRYFAGILTKKNGIFQNCHIKLFYQGSNPIPPIFNFFAVFFAFFVRNSCTFVNYAYLCNSKRGITITKSITTKIYQHAASSSNNHRQRAQFRGIRRPSK